MREKIGKRPPALLRERTTPMVHPDGATSVPPEKVRACELAALNKAEACPPKTDVSIVGRAAPTFAMRYVPAEIELVQLVIGEPLVYVDSSVSVRYHIRVLEISAGVRYVGAPSRIPRAIKFCGGLGLTENGGVHAVPTSKSKMGRTGAFMIRN